MLVQVNPFYDRPTLSYIYKQTSSRLRSDVLFWRLALKICNPIHPHVLFRDCQVDVNSEGDIGTLRRIAIRMALVRHNLSTSHPLCKSLQSFQMDVPDSHRVLDLIQGALIMITWFEDQETGILGIHCWDLVTGSEIGSGFQYRDILDTKSRCKLDRSTFTSHPGCAQHIVSVVLYHDDVLW
jgi:hypothetical protein